MKRFISYGVLSLVVTTTACGGGTTPAAESASARAEQTPVDTSSLPDAEMRRLEEAIQKMDSGDLDQAEELCRRVLEKHPHHLAPLFELSLLYRMQGQPERAVSTLAPYSATLPAQAMAALASAQDEAGHSDEALEVVLAGLSRFPQSGLLYSTKGVILEGQGNNAGALEAYQQGAQAEPSAPANHLRIATLLAGSDLGAMVLLHGEIFRGLEPGSERSRKVALLMMQTLSERVTVETSSDGESSVAVRLVSPQATGGDPQHPLQVYELALGMPLALVAQDGFTFKELLEARAEFVGIWWEQQGAEPHPLAKYLHDLQTAGHLPAYSAWLFAPAYQKEASEWAESHRNEIEAYQEYEETHAFASYLQ